MPAKRGQRQGRHFFGHQEDEPEQWCCCQRPRAIQPQRLHGLPVLKGGLATLREEAVAWQGHGHRFVVGSHSGSMAAEGYAVRRGQGATRTWWPKPRSTLPGGGGGE